MNLFRIFFLSFFISIVISSNLFSQSDKYNALISEVLNTYKLSPSVNAENFIKSLYHKNGVTDKKRTKSGSLSVVDSVIITNEYGDKEKYSYTYDLHGNITTMIFETFADNIWIKDTRETFTYDSNGNIIEQLEEFWFYGEWVIESRQTNTYDSNGNRVEELDENWFGNAWGNNWRKTFTYNSNSDLTLELRENWYSNAWLNDWRNVFTYDASGNMTLGLSELWDWENNIWMNNGKATRTYDAYGHLLTEFTEWWVGDAWEIDLKYSCTYDSNWNMDRALGFFAGLNVLPKSTSLSTYSYLG